MSNNNLLTYLLSRALDPILTVSSIYHDPSSQNESHRHSQGQFEVLEHLQM